MRKLLILGLLLGLSLFVACGDDPEEKKNEPPTIISTQLSPNPAEVGTRITLYVQATDPEGKVLTANWTGTGPSGAVSFEGGISTEMRVFFVPTVAGNFTFTVTVTDPGNLTDTETLSLTVTANPKLTVSTTNLNFGTTTTEMTFKISNTGSGPLTASITENEAWLVIVPTNPPALNPNTEITVNATIDRNGLDEGTYNGTVSVNSDGGNATVNIVMQVEGSHSEEVFVIDFSDEAIIDSILFPDENTDYELSNGKLCLTALTDETIGYATIITAIDDWSENDERWGEMYSISADIACTNVDDADPEYSFYGIGCLLSDDDDVIEIPEYEDEEGDLFELAAWNVLIAYDGYSYLRVFNANDEFLSGAGWFVLEGENDYLKEPPGSFREDSNESNNLKVIVTEDADGNAWILWEINNELVWGYGALHTPVRLIWLTTMGYLDIPICFDNFRVEPADEFENRLKFKPATPFPTFEKYPNPLNMRNFFKF